MNDPVSSSPGPSLALQMQHAAQCLRGVQAGRSLTELLSAVPATVRPGVQAIAFHALRQAGLTAALVRLLAARAPSPAVRTLMQVALSLMPAVCVAEADPQYDAHTLVNQAVQAAKADRDSQAQSGFVNACLRRFLREADTLLAEARRDPVALWNHPAWWIRQVRHDHPQDWQAILRANNQPGGMALRVNTRQGTRDAYLQQLLAQGMAARPVGEDGVVLDRAVPVDRLPDFEQGRVSVQDTAAQLAAPLLLAGRAWPAGARVLDACAAPGGKTAHVLEHADVVMWALDADAGRCERIHENLRRLGLQAKVVHADAGRPADWWDGQLFDAILLDAPCTASGIVRRHPDVRWLRRESDIAQLAALQRQLLDALWPLLKPGGCLLYATCSVFRAEGDAQIAAFLERHTEARLGPAPGHLLPGSAGGRKQFNDNALGEHDGFFYARLDKPNA